MKEKNYIRRKREKGITLIALVITVIILIILATVTINVVLGEDGLTQRAQEAKRLTEQATVKEQKELNTLMGEFTNLISEPETSIELIGIEISNPPTKTAYIVGENFETTGMVVNAKYSDGSSRIITDYIVTDGNNLPEGKTSVNISYTEGEISKTVTQNITVVKLMNIVILNADISTEIYSFTVPKGYTWKQYIDSEYNTSNGIIYIENGNVMCKGGEGATAGMTESVLENDLIDESLSYYSIRGNSLIIGAEITV